MFVVVHGKTVRYSNVPPRAAITTKTYDLEVPGSAPIRIIEAEPIWSNEEVPSTTPSYMDGLEHRSTKHRTGKEYVTTQPTKTTISEPVTYEPDHPSEYSPDALNAFLKDYADKVKADRKKYNEDEEENSTEGFSDEEKENNKPKSWGLVETKHHNHPFDDKKGWVSLEAVPWSSSKISKWQSHHKNEPKPWENNNKPSSNWNFRPQQDLEYDNSNDNNFNNYNSNNNPFNSNKNNFNNYNNNKPSFNNHDNSNSFNGYNDNDNSFHDNKNNYDNQESNFNNDKNSFGYGNHNNNFNNKFNSNSNKNVFSNNDKFNYNNGNSPNDQYNPNDNIFFDKPYAMYDVNIKPSSPFPPKRGTSDPKPVYGYDQRPLQVKPSHSDWPDEIPSRPSWNKPPPIIFSNKPVPEPWFDRKPPHQSGYNSNSASFNNDDDHRDIITDGRPGDFPSKSASKPYPTYDSISNRPVNSLHPSTHPENGNGEWILVSTTKGYQYPRSKHQRSIEVTPNSIGTRRGIRLTVLPPDTDSPVNMTTSHGGLLEVESTFQSVEEAHKQFSERLKTGNKTRLTTHKIGKKPVRQQVLKIPKPSTQKRPGKRTPVVHNKQDATAVLAAVGAGMVPATMAMLVPFVTGRKRRSIADSELTNIVPNITRYSSRKANYRM